MNSTRSSHGLNVGVTSLPDQPTPQAVAEFCGAAFWQNEASNEPVIKLAAVEVTPGPRFGRTKPVTNP